MCNNDLLNKIGDYCRIARIKERITQKQMAEYCGVTQQTISQFEMGKNNNCLILFHYMAICNHCRELMKYLLELRNEVLNNAETD